MPAVAYACFIRIVRALEDEGLYSHESEVLRAAADAKLLSDEDVAERLSEAAELLEWLEDSDRIPADTVGRLREHLATIDSPLRRSVPARPAPAPRQQQRTGRMRRTRAVLRFAFGLPAPAPQVAPAASVPSTDEGDDVVAELVGKIESGLMLEQAERFLAFHAWLDQNERR